MMTNIDGCKASCLSESIDSIETYNEAGTIMQFRSISQDGEGSDRHTGNATSVVASTQNAQESCESTSAQHPDVLATESSLRGSEGKAGQDVVIHCTSLVDCQDEVGEPYSVINRTSERQDPAQVTTKTASPKKTAKNSKKVKRRPKSEDYYDVPAALKSLRRRPRSGFPQRPGILARRGVHPQCGGSREDDWADLYGASPSQVDEPLQRTSDIVTESDITVGCNRSVSSHGSRDSWVDASNDDSSPCSSPLDQGRLRQSTKCQPSIVHQSSQTLAERERTGVSSSATLASDASEYEISAGLQRTSISGDRSTTDTPDSNTDNQSSERTKCTSISPSGHGQRRHRESMTLSMENPPEELPVLGSRIRLDSIPQTEELVSPTTNIFVTSPPQTIGQIVISPHQASETASAFVFPEPHPRTASVAPAPSQSYRASATLNSSVVTPPRQSSASGGRKGRGRPKDFSDVPAALRSLRRKPRSGFSQRTSFMSRMQVGPQEPNGSTGDQSRHTENIETNDYSGMETSNVMISENPPVAMPQHIQQVANENQQAARPRSALLTHSQTLDRVKHQAVMPSHVVQERSATLAVITSPSNDSSHACHSQETAALRSMRRHPRSGFRRHRPTVSSHFVAACTQATSSGASCVTPLPSTRDEEAAEDLNRRRHSGPSAEPVEQVVVSRRPALPDPDRASPPPAYDALYFYDPVPDEIAEAFRPEQFSPILPSYDDVLRLSQESPPPYMESIPTDDNDDIDTGS